MVAVWITEKRGKDERELLDRYRERKEERQATEGIEEKEDSGDREGIKRNEWKKNVIGVSNKEREKEQNNDKREKKEENRIVKIGKGYHREIIGKTYH